MSVTKEDVVECLGRSVTRGMTLTAIADDLGLRKQDYARLRGLLAELVGAERVATVPGGASCSGGIDTGYRINLESRIATRVLWRVARGAYRNEADIYRLAHDIDWTRLF